MPPSKSRNAFLEICHRLGPSFEEVQALIVDQARREDTQLCEDLAARVLSAFFDEARGFSDADLIQKINSVKGCYDAVLHSGRAPVLSDMPPDSFSKKLFCCMTLFAKEKEFADPIVSRMAAVIRKAVDTASGKARPGQSLPAPSPSQPSQKGM